MSSRICAIACPHQALRRRRWHERGGEPRPVVMLLVRGGSSYYVTLPM